MIQPIRWIFQKLAYFLYARRKLVREDSVDMMGLHLTVPPGVFHPVLFRSSHFFARYLADQPLEGAHVLDLGSGSGILALVMARSGARVTATDINPAAVEATRENARSNGLSVEARQSDLFQSLNPGRRYDLIAWNPPFYGGEPGSLTERAWRAGEELQTIQTFARTARSYLRPGGRLLMSVSTEMDLKLFRSYFRDSGWSLREAASERWLFERFYIYEIRPVP